MDIVALPPAGGHTECALASRLSVVVDQHRDAIRALVNSHHATAPRLFGSIARGGDEPGSDLDLLVDFTEDASLVDETGLRLALVDLLGVDVDVVALDALKGQVRACSEKLCTCDRVGLEGT